jgi:TPR repeat protein
MKTNLATNAKTSKSKAHVKGATRKSTSAIETRVYTREQGCVSDEQTNNTCNYGVALNCSDQKRRVALTRLYHEAKLGSAPACLQLGLYYLDTDDVWEGEWIAFGWIERGAIGGDLGAMAELSRSYRKGIGIEMDSNLATHWLSRSQGG